MGISFLGGKYLVVTMDKERSTSKSRDKGKKAAATPFYTGYTGCPFPCKEHMAELQRRRAIKNGNNNNNNNNNNNSNNNNSNNNRSASKHPFPCPDHMAELKRRSMAARAKKGAKKAAKKAGRSKSRSKSCA